MMDLLSLTVVAVISFVLSLILLITITVTVYIHIQHRKYAHIPGPRRKGIKG